VTSEDASSAPRDAAWFLAGGHFAEPDVALDGLRRCRSRQVR